MPDNTPEEQPRGELVPSSGPGSALDAWQNLSEEDRLSLIGQLQRLGVSFAQFQSLLQTVSTTNISGGVNMQGGNVTGSVIGRDSNVFNLNLSINDRETLQQVVQALTRFPTVRDPLYAALRSAAPDLELDFAALAHRLYDRPKPGSPVDAAKREQAVYVPLALKFSRHRRVSAQAPFEHDQTFNDIVKAVDAARAPHEAEPEPALVLLGTPGGGKSTALRHLMLDRLNRLLSDPGAHLPLFVSLGDYRVEALGKLRRFLNEDDLPLNPLNFLRAHWHTWFGDDGFERALDAGRLWLILDGLNEIPDRDNRIPDWAAFFDRQSGIFAAPSRAIIACRRADYGNRLDLPYLDLEELDWDRIRDFVGKRLQKMGQAAIDDVLRRLREDADLLEVVSNPFWLKMLTDYAEDRDGRLPEGRTDLIDSFVDKWLRPVAGRADLPPLPLEEIEALKSALEPFAYWMLDRSDNAPVEWSEAVQCCGAWGQREKDEVLRRSERASLLVSEGEGRSRRVKFYHQLILEYFAGRELAQRFRRADDVTARWRIPWSAWQFVNTEWRRLSEPPTTRWEEATVFAAARPEINFNDFVRAVLNEHPPLAARCLLEAARDVPPALKQAVIDRLLDIVERRDPLLNAISESSARLSLRIAAGHALGKLGDPRIDNEKTRGRASLRASRAESRDAKQSPTPQAGIASSLNSAPRNDTLVEVDFIEPRWCDVSAGPFTMGDDSSEFVDEKPQHTCDVIKHDYAIGMFPVTNAEYECFVKAGGYSNEHWWRTEAARRWLKEGTIPREDWLAAVRWYRDDPTRIENAVAENRMQPSNADMWRYFISKTDDEVIDVLKDLYGKQPRDKPAYQDNRDLNGANQPVVGVCWHEALAYCAWLTNVLRAAGRIRADQEVTLPSEPEWEKAARTPIPDPSPVPRKAAGQKKGAQAYPWPGDFDPDRANTLEGRVLTTTPVGVYDNASGCGALDLSGNVWEWTRSRWGDKPQQMTFGYPYSTDLEERERLDTDDYRVVRGGSWISVQSNARVTYRDGYSPGIRYDYRGFRCVLRSIA
jgi:formylglycine-generating enzyme required for sulfatase activity